MKLSEPFIRRPVMTTLLMVSILFFGFISYQALPVSDLPNIDIPTILVSVNYPGTNPETMANAIATPLEQQFMSIEGMQNIFSSSNTGYTSIVLQFDLNEDIDRVSTDVQAAISRAQSQLPSNLPNQPTYEKLNPSANPIAYYVLMAPNLTQGELYDYAYTFLGQRISMIQGVAQVITYGSPYAVRIQVDPEKLAAKKIGLNEVTHLVQSGNVELPLGTLFGSRDDYTLESDGQLLNAASYAELIIKNREGSLVKIKDIGRSLDSVDNDKFFMKYVTQNQNDPCIILAVQRLPGENTVRILTKVEKLIGELKPQLPQSLNITTIYNQSESIIESVNEVKLTFILAFLLVVLIIYLSLGKSLNTLIPAIALPVSVFGSFSIIYLLGFSIDILSMLALILSIGFLIDDAIVVLENNVRHVQLGETPFDASIKGSHEISTTIVGMTLCLIATFIPVLFMGGVVGKLFKEFAVTIVVTVFISGFISLSLTPLLCSRFIKPYEKEKRSKMEKISDAANEWLKEIYKPILIWSLNHRLFMLFLGTCSIIFSLILYKNIDQDFIPIDDTGYIQGYSQAREGTSPFLMEEYHDRINQIAVADPNIESLISISSYSTANQGFFFFKLKPYKKRADINHTIAELSKKTKEIAGINLFLSPLPLINLSLGNTSQAIYQYALSGIEQDLLFEYAPKLTNKIKSDPLFSQVSSDLLNQQPLWQFEILRDKASNYHVTAKGIEDYLGWSYSNNKISQINGKINQYNVIIETLPEFYKDPTVFSKLYITSNNNTLVPLSEIVKMTQTVGPLTINHINGLPAVTISFNPARDIPLGTLVNKINEITQAELPGQIQGQVIGTAQIFHDSFATLNVLLLIAFFIIYIVLGILYESFIHPITVMSTLPPTLFGGLLTLYLFNQVLSIYSFIGLILLIGIVLKNGIMIVDFANAAIMNEKKTSYDAIIEACLIRFRPILMTTLAAIMGALPIALGIGGGAAQSRIALGLCIVGGLVVSQLLTLFLTPVIYYYFEILQEKIYGYGTPPQSPPKD